MSVIFEATDPRGLLVICTESIWQGKILGKHTGMQGWEDEVKEAIENPMYGIYADATHENRCVYYRRRQQRSRQWIKVVVQFDEPNKGLVITAFMTANMKSGEKLIWPKSSR